MARKKKLTQINYSYHPNFVQDDTAPMGYRLLDGGKWVVEWDLRDFKPYGCVPLQRTHYSKPFKTEVDATRFITRLRQHVEDDGGLYLTDEVQDIIDA